jgi:hypothetical protein
VFEGERETEKKGRESGAEGKERKIQRKRKKVDRGGRSDEKGRIKKKMVWSCWLCSIYTFRLRVSSGVHA